MPANIEYDSDTDYSYIESDEIYCYTSTANVGGQVVYFGSDGIRTLTMKESAIEEIKSQPFFR